MATGPVCLSDKYGKLLDIHKGSIYQVCKDQASLLGNVAVALSVDAQISNICTAWFPDAVAWLRLPQSEPGCACLTCVVTK